MSHIDNSGGYLYYGSWSIWEISVSSSIFYYKPKNSSEIILKNYIVLFQERPCMIFNFHFISISLYFISVMTYALSPLLKPVTGDRWEVGRISVLSRKILSSTLPLGVIKITTLKNTYLLKTTQFTEKVQLKIQRRNHNEICKRGLKTLSSQDLPLWCSNP